jgi:DNA excision repair protein ERCC-2
MDFFPYETLRDGQSKMIESVRQTLEKRGSIVINAPTGIGKTSAALAPALDYALQNDKKVFFLTSRQTQHRIALSTVKAISNKTGKNIKCIDIIGRQSLCLVEGIDKLYSNEFAEYCRSARRNGSCLFYNHTIQKDALTKKAEEVAQRIEKGQFASSFEVKDACVAPELCPYEILMKLAKDANVVIADYYYVFNPHIRISLFSKIGLGLEDAIVIVDEAHNLPQRIRRVMSSRLTSNMTKRAIQEARKYKLNDCIPALSEIQDALNEQTRELELGQEKLVKGDAFISRLNLFLAYDDIIELLEDTAETVRLKAKHSYIGGIAEFLESWKGDDEGFARIISLESTKSGETTLLNYRCLDPSIASREVGNSAHSIVLMSATLSPPEMYATLLGLDDAELLTLKSPFPTKNRMNLIVPKTTTKYTRRNEAQFKQMAAIILDIAEEVRGNMAVYFPSYFILRKVKDFFESLKKNNAFEKAFRKPLFSEFGSMDKSDKEALIERFKKSSREGGILFGVVSGSFAEGIDLPGEYLSCVVTVGIPFPKPDLETKELIKYYNEKYSNGMFYGYIFPTMNKIIQASGRCIRTEQDRGVIVFLDERYAWPIYKQCFPPDWWIEIARNFKERIKEFFDATESKEN